MVGRDMKFLLVVFFLIDGQWVQGEGSKGWGAIPYVTEVACLTSKASADAFQQPGMRFECIAEHGGKSGNGH